MGRLTRRTARWRWFAVAAAASIIGGVVVTEIVPASAVHEVGVFELDHGTSGANAFEQASVPGDDWDNVCHETSATVDCGTTTPTAGASAVSWTSDGDLQATIFTGGGSKDPQPIDQWLWKDGAGGLPDKDNLLHAFAARYTTATSSTCPSPDSTCDVLYFGMDRYDNAGDAQLGFWFFKQEVKADGASSQGGNKFTGAHTPGDLLVLSDFSVGGTVSTINVYEWVASGGDVSEHLKSLGGGINRDCSLVGAADSFCGIVNKDPTPSSDPTDDLSHAPWSFTDKKNNSDFAPGELFEGGINLSNLGLGGECFASFAVESRSSTSPSATLKDFVIGKFGACTSSITSQQTWTPADSATIGVSGKAEWTGTVSFDLFDNATCTTPSVYTSDALPVSNTTNTVSTDDSTTPPDAVSAPGGNYSWQVFFDSGTSGVPDQTSCVEATTLTIDNDTSG